MSYGEDKISSKEVLDYENYQNQTLSRRSGDDIDTSLGNNGFTHSIRK